MPDLLLQELLPFAEIKFSGLFSVVFGDIDLKFGKWICHDIMQMKLGFATLGLLLQELLPFAKIYFYTPVFRRDVLWYGDVRPSWSPSIRPSVTVFRTFLLHALRY